MANKNNRVKSTNDLDLKDRLVTINRVTKVTKGGRAFTFAAIVVVGDGNGVIGWGLGKANEEQAANAKGVEAGKKNNIEVVVGEAGLDNAVGLELVTLVTDKDGQDRIYQVIPSEMKGQEGNKYTLVWSCYLDNAGSFKVCYRMYPKNENLPHRQDFCYVKWFV